MLCLRTQIHLFPFCKKIEAGFANITDSLHYSHLDTGLAHPVLRGYSIFSSAEGFKASVDWMIPFAAGDRVTAVSANRNGAIASFGRVLGDRTTLYKYLNPHLAAYTTVNAIENTGSVLVIDTTTGAVVYRTALKDIDTSKGMPLVLEENWLVYSFAEKDGQAKKGRGQRLVSVELFEGLIPNERSNRYDLISRLRFDC